MYLYSSYSGRYLYCVSYLIHKIITKASIHVTGKTKMQKTHKVIDLTDEDFDGKTGVFSGTEEECHDFIQEQGFGIGYEVIRMTKEEIELNN